MALKKREGREQKKRGKRSDSYVITFVCETFPFCAFSVVPGPVEQHTELADYQPGGSPCYSSYFMASNMPFGPWPGLDFNKKVE